MKCRLLILFAISSLFVQAQIPNAGFENWTGAIPDNWFSQTGYTFVAPDSNAHSGNLSLRFQTVADSTGVSTTTLTTRIVPGSSYYPVGVSTPPVAITFWAVTNLIAGDVLTVNTTLKNAGGVIGIVNGTCVSAVSPTWQFYSFPITYTTLQMPDSSATWFSFRNGTCVPNINPIHAGTYALIDDVAFDGATGMNSLSVSPFHVYPNPAGDFTTIDFAPQTGTVKEISLFDAYGKRVMSDASGQVKNNSVGLNLGSVSDGIYFVKISTTEITRTFKLIVDKN